MAQRCGPLARLGHLGRHPRHVRWQRRASLITASPSLTASARHIQVLATVTLWVARTYGHTMRSPFSRHQHQPRGWAGTAALVLLVLVAGCSSGAAPLPSKLPEISSSTTAALPTDPSAPPVTSPTPAGATGFCDDMVGIDADLSIANFSMDWTSNPQGYIEAVNTAAERFSTVPAPPDIVDEWATVDEFFAMAAAALDGVDPNESGAIEDALRFNDDQAFVLVIQVPGLSEAVGVYVQEECGVDLGVEVPAISNVCEALDPSHLSSVFGDTLPRGDNRRWGEGVVECVWDDGAHAEVGIVVGPLVATLPELVQGQEPIDAVHVDDATIDVYDGALGPLRSAAGRTAVTDNGVTAVITSVRTGDVEADALKAVALVGLMADLLP